MLALAVFATRMCTDVQLMPEKTRQWNRTAAKTDPVDSTGRPTDRRLCGREVCAAERRVYYFRIQLVTITS